MRRRIKKIRLLERITELEGAKREIREWMYLIALGNLPAGFYDGELFTLQNILLLMTFGFSKFLRLQKKRKSHVFHYSQSQPINMPVNTCSDVKCIIQYHIKVKSISFLKQHSI